MIESAIFHRLQKLYDESPIFEINKTDKIIILSDVHLGNGSYQDDFKQNSDLFKKILLNYYFPRNYTLVLAGDIEELYKFHYPAIYNAWRDIYEIFNKFNKENRLFKIFGNHDYLLSKKEFTNHNYKLYEGIKFKYNDNLIFIYHGHQTSGCLEDYNRFSSWIVRNIATPLGMKNKTFSFDYRAKFKNETYSYKFAAENRLLTIVGHTHRALFESYSKYDSLKIEIETLLSLLDHSNPYNKEYIINRVKKLKSELKNSILKNPKLDKTATIYNEDLLVPCLFNSGSVIGDSGATGIEIKNGKIALVYWFDRKRSSRYLNYDRKQAKVLKNTDYYKINIKKDSLENIFLRINLLT